MTELMNSKRHQGETIDALIQRFRMLKWRAAQGNAGIQMTWEWYAWLLLKAIGINQGNLAHIQQPTQGRFPNTQDEFEQVSMHLRRLGHIFENSPHNIAPSFTAPPGRMFPVWEQSSRRPGRLIQSLQTHGRTVRTIHGEEVLVQVTPSRQHL